MLFINYKGDTPQQRYYSLGVKGNSNANKITFVVEARQNDISLLGLLCNLKVQDKEHKYLDLIELEGVYDEDNYTITFEWSMPLKSTQYRNLELQLEFIGGDEEIVWQTLIAELELNETIKVGETLDDKEISVLRQMEVKVDSAEKEIAHIKSRRIWNDVKVEYSHGNTTFFMPRGIVPLFLELDEMYYFDYELNRCLDSHGEKLEDVILFSEDTSVVSIIFENRDLRGFNFYEDGGTLIYIERDCEDDWTSVPIGNTYNMLHGSKALPLLVEITHEELKRLRDNGLLQEGCFYRIIDYTTMVDFIKYNYISDKSHYFDVVVLALSNDRLSENAWAVHSNRDSLGYFSNNDLESWKLKYTIDNEVPNEEDENDISIFPKGDIIYVETDYGYYSFSFRKTATINNKTYYLYQNPAFNPDGTSNPPYVGSTKEHLEEGDTLDHIDMDATFIVETNVGYVEGVSSPKGIIYEMTDEFNNTLPFDFKNVVFKFYRLEKDTTNPSYYKYNYVNLDSYYDEVYPNADAKRLYNAMKDIFNLSYRTQEWFQTSALRFVPSQRVGYIYDLGLPSDLQNYLLNNYPNITSKLLVKYMFGSNPRNIFLGIADFQFSYFYVFTGSPSEEYGVNDIYDASIRKSHSITNNKMLGYTIFVRANNINNNVEIENATSIPTGKYLNLNVFQGFHFFNNKIINSRSNIAHYNQGNFTNNEIENCYYNVIWSSEITNNIMKTCSYNTFIGNSLGYGYVRNNLFVGQGYWNSNTSIYQNVFKLGINNCICEKGFQNNILQQAEASKFSVNFQNNDLSLVVSQKCIYGAEIEYCIFRALGGNTYMSNVVFESGLQGSAGSERTIEVEGNNPYSTYYGNDYYFAYKDLALKANFVKLTQAEYDALVQGGEVDEDTYYFIEEE